MSTRDRGRAAYGRPRPPSAGRPYPARPIPQRPGSRRIGPSVPSRTTSRGGGGPRVPIVARIALLVGVVALGGAVLFVIGGVLPRALAVIGDAFSGLSAVSSRSPTPTVRATGAALPGSPELELPEEAYTNQATIDVAGRVPLTLVGLADYSVRLYQSVEGGAAQQIDEQEVGATPGFTFPAVELSKGRNDFTATIVGPSGESEPSTIITYVLDLDPPKISISSPKQKATVNGTTVTIKGTTQARSTLSARNEANGATATADAGPDGRFSIVVALASGTNGITITSTDPAGNSKSTVLTVRRGGGKLTAGLTPSAYQLSAAKLPRRLTLSVVVTDPNGRAVRDASVTFTLSIPGVPTITAEGRTDASGTARFTTTVPKGATVGAGLATALVDTSDFGKTTARTAIAIVK